MAHLFLVSLKAVFIDSICLPSFPFISPLSHSFYVFFFPCYSRSEEFNLLVYSAHRLLYSISTLDHFQDFIKNSFAFLPFTRLPFHSPAWDCDLRPSLLIAYMLCASIITHVLYSLASVQILWLSGNGWLTLHSCLASFISLVCIFSRTHLSSAFSIWAMPTHSQLSFFSQPRIWQVPEQRYVTKILPCYLRGDKSTAARHTC